MKNMPSKGRASRLSRFAPALYAVGGKSQCGSEGAPCGNIARLCRLLSRQEAAMPKRNEPREFTRENVRQGHIVLRSPARKVIFIAGLAGIVVLAALLVVSACVPTP